MINTIITFLKKNLWQIVLGLIVVVIGIINYAPKYYLSGWDNLQTELYPWLAVKRAFFSAWQEYQSFGLVSGMAHAADLVRALFVVFLSFILPQQAVRYVFHILMLFIGANGAYILINEQLGPRKQIFAFFGGLFYLLNFGTIQLFYVPYEAFTIFYAMLPWELWIFIKILHTREKSWRKDLIVFVIINILATPQAYVQTLFVVYFGILVLISLGNLTSYHSIKLNFIRPFLLLTIIFCINSFWILPQIYFLKTAGSVVQQAKINQLSTETVYLQNLEKGTLGDVFTFKGFYYDLFSKNSSYLFLPWRDHFKNETTTIISVGCIVLFFIGLFSNRKKTLLFTLPTLGILIPLLSRTPLFEQINSYMRNVGLIGQIFRSPFTKFIIPFSLFFSFFIASGVAAVVHISRKFHILQYLFYGIVFGCIIFQSLPVFRGFLFAPDMRVSIPSDYKYMINYFKTVDTHKRIALLPDYTFWGWFLTRWGYNGSGFIWYGIEQPIVSRTFDVWSSHSESYFWEMKQAIDSNNVDHVQQVLIKYNISYLILDKTLLPVTSSAKGMQYEKLNSIFNSLPTIKTVYEGKDLSLYEVMSPTNSATTGILASPPSVSPQVEKTDLDVAYFDHTNYVYGDSITNNKAIVYPFLDLMTQTKITNPTWTLTEYNDFFQLASLLPINKDAYEYYLPSDSYQYTQYFEDGRISTQSASITAGITIDNQFVVRIGKIPLKDYNLASIQTSSCSSTKNGKVISKVANSQLTIGATDGAAICFGVNEDSISQKNGYLFTIDSQTVAGRGIFFNIVDRTNRESVMEDRLINGKNMYLVPPRDSYGVGYNFSFQLDSHIGSSNESNISKITLFAFPFDTIKHIYAAPKDTLHIKTYSQLIPVESTHNNYYQYVINSVPNTIPESAVLVLNQAYDDGWKAYEIQSKNGTLDWLQINTPFLSGTEIKEHILVNNWANGWALRQGFAPQGKFIVLIFWPQYLEYGGFVVLTLTFVGILFWKKHKQRKSSTGSPP